MMENQPYILSTPTYVDTTGRFRQFIHQLEPNKINKLVKLKNGKHQYRFYMLQPRKHFGILTTSSQKTKLHALNKLWLNVKGECQRSPHLSRRAVTLRLVTGFLGSLRRQWSDAYTTEQKEYLLSQNVSCLTIAKLLVIQFVGIGQ